MRISLKQYEDLLIKYLRPQKSRVWWLALLLFANIGLQLVNPQIMRRFLDAALAGAETESLTALALFFIAVALVQQLVAVGATYVGENVGWTATNWLRYDLARHCLYLDMSFHNEHTPGEMIERIDGDINALTLFFSQFILQVIGNGLLLIGVLILLFGEDGRVGLVLTLFVIVTLAVVHSMRNLAVPYWKVARQASADYFSFLEERLAGTEEIRASGAKAYVMRRFFALLRFFWQTTAKARVMGALMLNITWTLFAVGTAVAFVVGAALYRSGDLTLGAVYLIFHYTTMLSRPIERITQQFETLQQAGAGVARIQELFHIQNRITPAGQADLQDRAISPGEGQKAAVPGARPARAVSVAFHRVSFAYPAPNDHPSDPDFVLRDVSFHLAPRRVLGLLGRTGSGKTTLTRLLFRLYDPSEGCLELAGINIRHLPLLDLRPQVGMVTQNVQLFHATIRDNLTFFDRTTPDGKIIAVLQELGLGPWLAALPQGLDTVLAAGGGLSAGEAQLLAFARIFLKDPGLVILDEASSRLDPATEQLIERAIDRLLQERTAIIIAHRLKTVDRADEIMILENGRIQEHGPRAQLANDPASHFYHLLQTGLEEVLV
jgi:ABC-type multidrug transport system fused ATPase/permease subunit